jgi:hypothetical protein
MTAHENNGIQGAMSKKGRANLGSAFFVYIQVCRLPVKPVEPVKDLNSDTYHLHHTHPEAGHFLHPDLNTILMIV